MKRIPKYQQTAILLSLLLSLLALGSLFWIEFRAGNPVSGNRIAHIYQDGELIRSIPLNEVTDTYTFTVTGAADCHNEIEVRPGSIGMISADCPDKLCVHQGFIDTSLLPITCLPNHLVIQITEENSDSEKNDVDIVTY